LPKETSKDSPNKGFVECFKIFVLCDLEDFNDFELGVAGIRLSLHFEPLFDETLEFKFLGDNTNFLEIFNTFGDVVVVLLWILGSLKAPDMQTGSSFVGFVGLNSLNGSDLILFKFLTGKRACWNNLDCSCGFNCWKYFGESIINTFKNGRLTG
jgi:hypothetical protein